MDYTGRKFGRLTVISQSPDNKCKLICRCDCGRETEVFTSNLTRGHTRSCGCLKEEIVKAGAHTIHGKRHTRLYGIWRGMRKRCRDKNGIRASSYVEKGIKVCAEWEDFSTFEAWALSHGYDDTLSIDRIDNDGDYCPENCRWATSRQQANNRSSNHFVEYGGERHTIAEWSRITGIPQGDILSRITRSLPIEEVFAQ